MRGVPDEEIGVYIDQHSVADRVVAGLLEHKSGHHVMFDDPTEVKRWGADRQPRMVRDRLAAEGSWGPATQ